MQNLLDKIDSPEVLRSFKLEALEKLADEIRELIIKTVSTNGGHLAASLGTVDLSIALHYVLNCPADKLIWDVGHQAYAHKLLTGRKDKFNTLRKYEGISAFPRIEESEYDALTVGHSSTSIAAALGYAKARDIKQKDNKVVAVIGDGALTGGLAFEALNNGLNLNTNVTVILNDNDMSISPNVGGLSEYLSKMISNPKYNKIKNEIEGYIEKIPTFGKQAHKISKKLQESFKNLFIPKIIFEEFGFRYFGVIDGHNIEEMIDIFTKVFSYNGPKLIHIKTVKGKGYKYAEENPSVYHGLGPFDIETGEPVKKDKLTYTNIFSDTIVRLGEKDNKIVAITAAMPSGTGLNKFMDRFPDRFFDVGIAEGFAVTFSAGLKLEGLKPIVAIYSTFLQRAYDQLIHDIGLQKLPVVFAIDRGGLVGDDGPTHHGCFDLSYLNTIPGFTVMAPANEFELVSMLEYAVRFEKGPIAMRYPRGVTDSTTTPENGPDIELGKCNVVKEGKDVLILSIGTVLKDVMTAEKELSEKGISATVINARFLKPLDDKTILDYIKKIKKVLVVEENTVIGGFGSEIAKLILNAGLENIKFAQLGIPDAFVPAGTIEILKNNIKLNSEHIKKKIETLV